MQDRLSESISNLFSKLYYWFDAFVINLPNLLLALIVFFLAYFLAKKLSKKTTELLASKISQPSVRSLIGSFITITIVGLGLLLALGILNLDQALNSIIAGAGVAGLAIGLALQGTLSNTFSGISLSLKEDINVGDYIETNGIAGSVVDINLRDTKLRTLDNNLMIIPNNLISSSPFKNYSLTKDLRVVIETGVGFESDLIRVEEITKQVIAEAFPYRKDEIEFYYLSFGDSSINFQLRFWIEATEELTMTKARSKAITLIKKCFEKEQINIPYPITTVISSNTDEDAN